MPKNPKLAEIWQNNAISRLRRLANKAKWKVIEQRQSGLSESVYFTMKREARIIKVRISCHGGAPGYLQEDRISVVYPPRAGIYDKTLDDLEAMMLPPKKRRKGLKGK